MSDTPTPSESEETNPPVRRFRRPRSGRVIAGVGAGLAYRFDLDPLLVRVGLVALALLGGAGLVLYALLWILVPSDTSLEVRDDSARLRSPVRVALLVLLVLLIGVAVLRGQRVVMLARGPAPLVVVALVLLLFLGRGSRPNGMSLLRLLRRLLLFVLSLGALALLALTLFIQSTGSSVFHGTGARFWQPLRPSELQRAYVDGVGSAKLDLSDVALPRFTRVSATVGVGLLWVIVPENAVVTVQSRVGVGTASFEDLTAQGSALLSTTWTPSPSHVTAASPRLVLDVTVGMGHLRVSRAAPSPA